MQSENIDNKIRQAAEQHHPDYDGKAWNKMEKLLDRHLPQKDDRRRRVIFFLLLFLLMGGGAWLIISKPWQPRDQTLTVTESSIKTEPKSSTQPSQPANQANSSDNGTDKKVSSAPVIVIDRKNSQTNPDAVASEDKPTQHPVISAGKTASKINQQKNSSPGQYNNSEDVTIDINAPTTAKKETKPENKIISTPDNANVKPQDSDKKKMTVDPASQNGQVTSKSSDTKNDNVIEQPKTTDQKEKELAKKSGSKKKNTFFFSFSAAPDLSSVGLDNPGKVKLLTGAGFGYTFRDRLTVRTGFYTARKIYSATRDDYKPDITPPNWAYVDNIAADCKVYEIPLHLAYNFGQSKRHNWFAGAGLSSYIMKEEKYVYLYKSPTWPPYSYTKTIHDEYDHFFSVLNLSAGYQYKINRTFSISAEPYVKLPLKGVGYGKVKLNSAGVLFSVNMSPFHSPARK